MSSFYEREELEQIGFKSIGKDVLISRKTSIYGAEKMEIGDNVRIDDFCFLMGKIKLGSYIHIAPYCNLVAGNAGIEMEDFAGLSSRVSVYAVTDDYSGGAMTNPTIPAKYTNVYEKKVLIEKHAIVGASSVILPGVTVSQGSSCGAMALINKSTQAWSINVGAPAKKIGERSQDVLDVEKRFLEDQKENVQEFYLNQEKHITRTVTAEDIDAFAKVSGDYNPIHVDDNYASNSIFKKRIAHGMLSASYISAVLGTDFPGVGTIYLEQTLRFLRPVYVGETIEIVVRLRSFGDRGRATLQTSVMNADGDTVIEGEALVKLPGGKKCGGGKIEGL